MKKLYCVLFLLPAVCYASPGKKSTKKLEQEIIALQKQFERIDKKMSELIEKINEHDLLLAHQIDDAPIIAATCDTEQSTQTLVEETTLVKTTEEVKKPKLSWGRRIVPKEKIIVKEEVKKRVTMQEPEDVKKRLIIQDPIVSHEDIADAADSQGDN